MKRCGIVTIYDNNYNYGGQLQAYAMYRLFSSKGFDTKIISFKVSVSKYIKRRVLQLGLYKTSILVLKKILTKTRLSSSKTNSEKKIERFNSFMQLIPHTEQYTENSISKVNELFDFFVCGSDQIWNPGWWNEIYFLNFTNKPKFSYAASVARDNLTNEEKDYIKKKTKNYIGISVREYQTKELLESFIEKNVYFVLDPTLLVNREIWFNLLKNCSNIYKEKKYVLIYKIGPMTTIVKNIYKVSKKLDYEVVMICNAKNSYEKDEELAVDRIIQDAGPLEWLSLFYNAEAIFTDSFHGTAFSLIYNKDFWCFEKEKNTKYNENSRLHSLLNTLDLSERLLDNGQFDERIFDKSIDYEIVHNSLKELINKSNHYIDFCLRNMQ